MSTEYLRAGLVGATLWLASSAGSAFADQIVADDLIVQGSVCIGVACVNGEAFVSESLRLRGVINRIRVVDTSTTGGLATRDWLIDFNEDNGPADYMAFVDGGPDSNIYVPIMKLMAGAPENSIFVDSMGRVGLGTATPVRPLHIVTGSLTGLRIEQTGTFGATPQSWEMGVGGSELFFLDATNGFTTPFAIQPGAPNSTLKLASSGRIGAGTSNPTASLDIRSTGASIGAGNAVLKLVNPSGPTAFQLQPFGTGFFWNFAASDNNTFNVNRSGNGVVEMSLNGSGNLTISGTIKTAGPTCAAGCDAVFDAGYDLPSIEDHAEAMWAKKHLPIVGPTLPNQPVDLSERYGLMACCRFRGHRDKVFNGTGEWEC
jgi:hypothetical protein